MTLFESFFLVLFLWLLPSFDITVSSVSSFVTTAIMVTSIVYNINAAIRDPDFLLVVAVVAVWPLPLRRVMTCMAIIVITILCVSVHSLLVRW